MSLTAGSGYYSYPSRTRPTYMQFYLNTLNTHTHTHTHLINPNTLILSHSFNLNSWAATISQSQSLSPIHIASPTPPQSLSLSLLPASSPRYWHQFPLYHQLTVTHFQWFGFIIHHFFFFLGFCHSCFSMICSFFLWFLCLRLCLWFWKGKS